MHIILEDDSGLTEIEQNRKEPTKEQEREIARAEDILRMLMSRICRKNIYIQIFADVLTWVPVEEDILPETDGIHLFYQPKRLLAELENRNLKTVERRILHILLHGILRHFDSRNRFSDRKLGADALDCEVEFFGKRIGLWECRLKGGGLENLGAGRIYHEAGKRPDVEKLLRDMHGGSEKRDDHEVWNRGRKYHWMIEPLSGQGKGAGGKDEKADAQTLWKSALEEAFHFVPGKTELEMLMDEQSQGQSRGSMPGGDCGSRRAAKKNDHSYREILWRFVKEHESSRVQEDSIDKMLYTYGFDLYQDIALIEPEECGDDKCHFRLVAVAVDTSASCSGEYIEKFLRETKNIFSDICQAASFDHIVFFQCDARIQEESWYEDPQELPAGDSCVIRGYGGTDFTPVFERLAEIETQQGIKPDCLLYLTDGEGCCPDRQPEYPTVFLLPEEKREWKKDDLPDWIEKVFF